MPDNENTDGDDNDLADGFAEAQFARLRNGTMAAPAAAKVAVLNTIGYERVRTAVELQDFRTPTDLAVVNHWLSGVERAREVAAQIEAERKENKKADREFDLRERELELKDQEIKVRTREVDHSEREMHFVAKTEFTNLGFKGLMLINAGAAAALAAFFQALVGKPDAIPLLPYVLNGIGFCVAGTTIAAGAFFFRYAQSLVELSKRKFLWQNGFWMVFWLCGAIALMCFATGLLYVVYGGLTVMNFSAPHWYTR